MPQLAGRNAGGRSARHPPDGGSIRQGPCHIRNAVPATPSAHGVKNLRAAQGILGQGLRDAHARLPPAGKLGWPGAGRRRIAQGTETGAEAGAEKDAEIDAKAVAKSA